jgi:glycosyltransferase involved in cell wall biosynthesis
MKILLFPAYYYPETAASSYLSENRNEAYVKSGMDIEIFTPMPCRGVSKDVREIYKQKKYEVLHDGHMIVHRFPMYAEGKNPIMRALRYFLCSCKYLYYGITIKNVDVLFLASTPPIQGALGALIKKWRKIPFVYNLQDIFPDSLVGTGFANKGGILWKIGRVIENFTYRNADKIIVISEDFKKNIMTKGVPENKIEVIYNWVDEKAIVPIKKEENPLFEEFDLDRNLFYVVYAGNLGFAQNIEIILQAAKKVENTDIKFLIFGHDKQAICYKNMAVEMKLNNLLFMPIQPYERVSFVYSLGNVAIVSCKEGFGSIGMPSKTWSIMSSGTAVLASFDEGTDMQRIIENNKVGLFTKAGDLNVFTEALLKLYNNKKECMEMGKRGRSFILNNLTREVGTCKYVEVIKRIFVL